MTRTIVRAFTCALFFLIASVSSASAATPTVQNITTGADPAHMTYGGLYDADTATAVGDTLRGNDNDWAATGIYVDHWYRCWDGQGSICEEIKGAVQSDYTVTGMELGLTIKFCAQVPQYNAACSPATHVVAARHPDADGDGVPNYADACDTTPGSTADGCPAPSSAPVSPSGTSTGSPPAAGRPPEPEQPAASASVAPPDPRGAANGAGASSAARITAVINNRSRSLRVAFGRKATITGQLLAMNGMPIARAELIVLSRTPAPNARFVKVMSLRTDTNGRYTYLAPAGPSRVIRVAYYAFGNDTAVADASDVTLRVSGALTLTAPKRVHNRHTVTFRGTLRGRPVPQGGVLVDLQVWFHDEWRTFATPRTNGRGAFRLTYRFTQGLARWKFRARMRKDSLYPYELGYSKQLGIAVIR